VEIDEKSVCSLLQQLWLMQAGTVSLAQGVLNQRARIGRPTADPETGRRAGITGNL